MSDGLIRINVGSDPLIASDAGTIWIWIDAQSVLHWRDENNATGTFADNKKVLVSANDTTEGFLEDKIIAGTGVSVTTSGEGANEKVEISSSAVVDPDLKAAQDDTLEPSGFVHNLPDTMGIMEISNNGSNIERLDELSVYSANSTGTFYDGESAAARTFRIMPKTGEDLIVWIGGERKTILAQSVQIPDTSLTHILYFDTTGALQTTNPELKTNFQNQPIIAIAYWNAAQQEYFLFANERHGIEMDGATHYYLHRTQKAKYLDGMEPLGLVDNSSTFTGIDTGTFVDEDITHSLAQQTSIPFWYLDGLVWRRTAANTNAGYIDSGDTYVSYNKFNGTGFVLDELSAGEFMYVFLVASNDGKYPYAKMLGQSKFANFENAKGSLIADFNSLDFSDAPSAEFIVIGAYIIDHTGAAVEAPCGCVFFDFRLRVEEPFGNRFNYITDEYTASEGNAVYIDYLTLTSLNAKQATYRIGAGTTWRHSSSQTNIDIQLTANGVEIAMMSLEPKDVAPDIRTPEYGAFYYTLAADGDLEVKIRFRTSDSDHTSYLYNGMIEIWRVI